MFDGALICQRKVAVPLNLTKSLSGFPCISITPLIQGESPRRGGYYPTNLTPWKNIPGDSMNHVVENVCSISGVYAIGKEFT